MDADTEARQDAIRDAAAVILVRRDGTGPRLLMGQRGRRAAFMPSKFVFPGGAVDAGDSEIVPAAALSPAMEAALGPAAIELANAAIRELWEETGLALARRAAAPPNPVPAPWHGFFAAGFQPAPDRLEFIFRATTPPGRPRRFDARFFLCEADDIANDLDDFSGAEEELSHLAWLSLSQARRLDLPFVTEIVLAEIAVRLSGPGPRPVPFFYHAGGRSFVTAL